MVLAFQISFSVHGFCGICDINTCYWVILNYLLVNDLMSSLRMLTYTLQAMVELTQHEVGRIRTTRRIHGKNERVESPASRCSAGSNDIHG